MFSFLFFQYIAEKEYFCSAKKVSIYTLHIF